MLKNQSFLESCTSMKIQWLGAWYGGKVQGKVRGNVRCAKHFPDSA